MDSVGLTRNSGEHQRRASRASKDKKDTSDGSTSEAHEFVDVMSDREGGSLSASISLSSSKGVDAEIALGEMRGEDGAPLALSSSGQVTKDATSTSAASSTASFEATFKYIDPNDADSRPKRSSQSLALVRE